MSKIFHEYGGTILTVIAVVLLISFVTTSMNTGGVLYNTFGSMINSFSEKSNDMVNGAAGGSGEGEEAGWPVSWNTMDVMDNPKVDMGDGTYLVKVSDYTPTAAELADTKMTATMVGTSASVTCIGVESMGDGCDIAIYDEDGMYLLLSVTTTEEIDGLQFPETGLWTIDYGSLGMDADVVVDVVPVLTEITELVDGVVLYDNDVDTWYATREACLIKYGLDTSTITYSTAGTPAGYIPDDGDVVYYGDYVFGYMPDGWSVVSAIDKSKQEYQAITKKIFMEDVTCIGTSAFNNCTSLLSITIPESITSIADAAFSDCTSLTSITIPDSVASIGAHAFNGCTNLTSIAIPKSVTNIESYAFAMCTGLTSIEIPDSVTNIGHYAFAWCYGLKNITIPDSVASIGGDAFASCTSLTSVKIGDGVTSIGRNAFEGCANLESIYISDLTAWFEISFGDGGSSILNNGGTLYLNGTPVINLIVPDNVTNIGAHAFANYTSLRSVMIPDSVSSIGLGAFYCCTGLTSISFEGSVEQWNAIALETYWNINVPATEVVCSDGVVSLVDG